MLGIKFERAAVVVDRADENYAKVKSWLQKWSRVISVSESEVALPDNSLAKRYDFVAPSVALSELPPTVVSKFWRTTF